MVVRPRGSITRGAGNKRIDPTCWEQCELCYILFGDGVVNKCSLPMDHEMEDGLPCICADCLQYHLPGLDRDPRRAWATESDQVSKPLPNQLQTISKPTPNHSQTNSKQFPKQLQTISKPASNHFQASFKPFPNQLQTSSKPFPNKLQTSSKPVSNHLQTSFKPFPNQLQQFPNQLQTIPKPASNNF